MASLTVSASEARANFSKLGEQIAKTGVPVTVFKNSKPWVVIMSATREAEEIPAHELKEKALRIASEIDQEYFDVFEALAK
jgi:prevent-host-death family protein